jgi:hypothetical protein
MLAGLLFDARERTRIAAAPACITQDNGKE